MKRKLDLEQKAVLQNHQHIKPATHTQIQPAPPPQIIYAAFKAPSKVTNIKPNARPNNASIRKQRVRSTPLPIAPAGVNNKPPPIPLSKNSKLRMYISLFHYKKREWGFLHKLSSGVEIGHTNLSDHFAFVSKTTIKLKLCR